MGLLDDLVAACAAKEPTKISDAFNDIMTGKAFDRVQGLRQDIKQTMFATPEQEEPNNEDA